MPVKQITEIRVHLMPSVETTMRRWFHCQLTATIHCTKAVKLSTNFKKRVQRNHVPAKLMIYSGTLHSFVMRTHACKDAVSRKSAYPYIGLRLFRRLRTALTRPHRHYKMIVPEFYRPFSLNIRQVAEICRAIILHAINEHYRLQSQQIKSCSSL